ncbi:retrovirus-related pol polyprotein from transposon TNT 1-94 [Tanacetum coccineum]
MNHPQLLAKGNKNSLASKNNSAFAGKLKNVKTEDESPLFICDIRKPIWYQDSGCLRHMTGVKSYLHKYVEQPGPKVVFGDDSTCTTEGYGSIKCTLWVYFLKKKIQAPKTIMSFIKRVENQNDIKVQQLKTDNGTKFKNSILVNFCDERGVSQNVSSPYTHEQTGVAERKNRTFIEAARTMLSGSVLSKQYWTDVVAIACYTQNRSTIIKRYLKTPYEIFHGRIPNIDFLHVFGCPVYIHNHKDYLGKFDEKADDEPYKRPEPVVIVPDASSDQNDQADQNDHSAQNNVISNDDQTEHSNHNNDNHIIDNLPNTKDVQTSEPLSSPAEDISVSNTNPILTNSFLSILSMASPDPQDKWYQDNHIELVNIIGNPGAGMLTRAMTK